LPRNFRPIFTIIGTLSRRKRAQQAENDENADENNADDTEVIAVPLVYALLSSKEKKQYKMVLGAVTTAAQKLHVRDCTPKKIMTDFEIGIVNAAEEEGSDETEVSCCFLSSRTKPVPEDSGRRPAGGGKLRLWTPRYTSHHSKMSSPCFDVILL